MIIRVFEFSQNSFTNLNAWNLNICISTTNWGAILLTVFCNQCATPPPLPPPSLSFSWWPHITVMSLSPQKRGRNSDKWVHLRLTPLHGLSALCRHRLSDSADDKDKRGGRRQEAQVKYVSLPPNLVKMSERMSAAVSESNARLQKWLLNKSASHLSNRQTAAPTGLPSKPELLTCGFAHHNQITSSGEPQDCNVLRENKLASLEATLVQNSAASPIDWPLTGGEV